VRSPAAFFERVLCRPVQHVDKRVLKLTADLLRLPVPTQDIPACRCMQGRIDEDLQSGRDAAWVSYVAKGLFS
jgi:hypothetical protein